MARRRSLPKRKGRRNPPRLAIASEGVVYSHCHGGCRRRQMTTTSLHGSSSLVALKKRKKKPTPSRNCKRGGGLSSSLWWVQTEADDDDEPTWLVVVRCLKKKEKDPPRLAIASEGVGYCRCRGCRRRQMTTTSLHGSSSFIALKKRNKKPTPSRNCKRGGGWFWVGRNPPRLAVACKGVGFCHLYCTVIVSNQ